MFYIQLRTGKQLETVDEFETRKEALRMLSEYRMAAPGCDYYLSSRPCRDWAKV
jgi:hypothetical protein